MTWFRVGGAGIPATLKNAMNAVFNKKYGTSGQNYPPKQWPDDVNLLGPLPEGTASGPIANFSDGADDVPVKSCVAALPASLDGYSQVNVNQCDTSIVSITDFVQGSMNSYGVPQASVTRLRSIRYSVEANKKYLFQVPAGFYIYEIHEFTTDETFIKYTTVNASSFVLTTSATTGKIAWLIRTPNNAVIVPSDVQYAYNAPSTTYTANLGRTIYGGTADVVTGEGQETFGVFTFDGSDDEDWSYSNGRFKITWPGTFEVFNTNHYRIRQCNNLAVDNVAAGSYELADNSVTWFTTNNIFIRKDDITSLENWKQYLLNNPLKIGGILATPESFTFTGQEVNSLYGVNNFWNDAGGDTTVVYRRDIDLALQAVSSSRGLMIASRPVTQLVGEESDPDQVNELVENDEIEQEGEDDAR